MEQLAVGSLIHFELLCEAAEQAEKDTDVGMSLQNPYVTMFVERFLNRDQYLDLKEQHLSAGACLIGLVSTYMDKAALNFLSAERLARIEAILEQQQNEGATTTTTPAEADLQHIVTVRWMSFYKTNDAGHVTGIVLLGSRYLCYFLDICFFSSASKTSKCLDWTRTTRRLRF